MANLRAHLALFALFSVLASLLVVSGPGFAQAPPGIPMIVSGSVTLNGNPAADGYNITAWDNGAQVGSALTSGGNYSVQVCGGAGQTCNQGDTISFQLGGLTASQTTSFNRGFPVSLNLTFTGTPSQGAQTMATTQAQTTAPVTTEVTSVATPEYPNYLPVLLVAALITLGVMASVRRRKERS